jgi:hypothetical protein
MKKRNWIVLSIAALAFASCSKTEDAMAPGGDGTGERTTGTGGSGSVIGAVPSTFTQKALLENFTSATDPDGAENDLLIRNATSANPTRVVAASFHVGDAMEGTPTYEITNLVNGGNTPALPGVMQNRLNYAGKLINDDMTWDAYLNTTLAATPAAGLAIETSVNGNVVQARVHAGFNSNQTGAWNLVVYVTRNNVTGTGSGYDQANGSNGNPASPLYHQGDPIVGYSHHFVTTKVLTPIEGTPVPPVYQTIGGHYVQQFVFDVRSTTVTSDLNVVAFLVDATDQYVLNAQQVRVGQTQNWD